jgi:hydroxymethylglutaryl-CoA reductase (NADPH)
MGMLAFNINVANAIAAIFVATGQDLASVHESSMAQLNLEKSEKGLKLELILHSTIK